VIHYEPVRVQNYLVGRCLWLIDQTKLPGKLEAIRMESVRQLVEAIQSLRVRGAPALGVAGAYGIALAADNPYL